MAFGWLQANRVPCTRKQFRAVVKSLRPEDFLARAVQAVQRRRYHLPFHNSLWHIDGTTSSSARNSSFMEAGIDGFNSLVTFISVSDSNRAVVGGGGSRSRAT